MKKNLIEHEMTGSIYGWAICFIIVGCLYIIFDFADRYFFENDALYLIGYKPVMATVKDFTFSISAIFGGILLLKDNYYGWILISYFSLGFLISAIYNILFDVFYRCNILEQFYLVHILALVALIRFWNKFITKFVFLVILIILILNLFVYFFNGRSLLSIFK